MPSWILEIPQWIWIVCGLQWSVSFLACLAIFLVAQDDAKTFPNHEDEVRDGARWLLTAVFFGWAIAPIFGIRLLTSVFKKAELPMPKLPKLLKGPVDRDAGSLSVVEDKGKVKRDAR